MNPQMQKQSRDQQGQSIDKIDPVCGTSVKSGDSNARSTTFRGQSYSFCSDDCRKKFETSPDQYIGQKH